MIDHSRNITLIAAITKDGSIGRGGKLLYHIPEDMKNFKEVTTNNIVIMGRKTYESIGHPLPNRENIVVSRSKKYEGDNLYTAKSVKEAIEMAGNKDVFIAGGYGVYSEAIPFVDVMYITEVELVVEDGDVFFPDFDVDEFDVVIGETLGDTIKYTRTIYTRKR